MNSKLTVWIKVVVKVNYEVEWDHHVITIEIYNV